MESRQLSTRRENNLIRKTLSLHLAVAGNLNILKLALLASSDGSLGCRGNDLLDAHDVPPRAQPVAHDIGQHEHEPDERHDVADARARRVGDGALDGREDGTPRHAHDHDARPALGVAAQVGRPQAEEGRVHGRHEEEDGDEHAHCGRAAPRRDVGRHGDRDGGVDDHDEVGLEDGRQARGDEAADGESDEAVREHLRPFGGGEVRGLGGVVDEEGGDGDLRPDVAELRGHGAHEVVLLIQGARPDALVAVGGRVVRGRGPLDDLFRDLGQLGEEEEHRHRGARARDGEVDVLHRGQVLRPLAREEGLGGDQGPDEGGDAVPRLAELQAGRGGGRVADDDGVRVGARLEGGEAAGDDHGADEEPAKGGLLVLRGGEVRRRPEHDGAQGVEAQAHDDCELVAAALEDLGRDGGEEQVASAKVHDLQPRGLEAGDVEDGLEVLVQDCAGLC